MPIVVCDDCGVHVIKADAFFTASRNKLDTVLTNIVSYCSLRCISESVDEYRGNINAYRWMNKKIGDVSHVGHRSVVTDSWVWNDTGEAIWIEENLARLRAAGENL
jgi:hypothetical protein